MNYVGLIQECITYIEDHLQESLTLEQLSNHFHLSKYHFHRIFLAVANQTLQTYVQQRKMSAAAALIRSTGKTMIDIAYECGFSSPEVFSRNFKKHFHVSPREYRVLPAPGNLTGPLVIIERQFRNMNKNVAVSCTFERFAGMSLIGRQTYFDIENENSPLELYPFVSDFAAKYATPYAIRRLYTISDSLSDGVNRIRYDVGIAMEDTPHHWPELTAVRIPASNYAVFQYKGNMSQMYRIALTDIYRWLCVTGLQIYPVGIDFFQYYDQHYASTGQFQIYLPVVS